jgi:hypothetical protein
VVHHLTGDGPIHAQRALLAHLCVPVVRPAAAAVLSIPTAQRYPSMIEGSSIRHGHRSHRLRLLVRVVSSCPHSILSHIALDPLEEPKSGSALPESACAAPDPASTNHVVSGRQLPDPVKRLRPNLCSCTFDGPSTWPSGPAMPSRLDPGPDLAR